MYTFQSLSLFLVSYARPSLFAYKTYIENNVAFPFFFFALKDI